MQRCDQKDSSSSIMNDPYYLLKLYGKEAKVNSRAQELSEKYHRKLFKLLNYPLVILSAGASVLAGLNINQFVTMGVSLAMLILIGFDKIIMPTDKAQRANQMKTEFGEISRGVKQFLLSNDRCHLLF